MNDKTLVTIMKDAQALETEILAHDGEVTDLIEKWMQVNKDEMATKADSYKYAYDQLQDSAEVLKRKAKMFSDAAKTLENASEHLKERLKYSMEQFGFDSISGNDFKWALTKETTKSKLIIEDEQLIPPSYMKEEIKFTPNEEEITQALKAGVGVHGCRIEVKKSRSLRATVNKTSKPMIGVKDESSNNNG